MTSRVWALAGATLALTVAVSCGGSSGDELSRTAEIYVVTIEKVLAEEPPATDPDDDLPIIYVIPLGESGADASDQAEVANELRETADVRFADERDEAVLEDDEGMPVRDDGVLLAVGDVAEEVDPVDVEVEVYRSEDDWSKRVLTFSLRSSRWTVTSTSVLSTP